MGRDEMLLRAGFYAATAARLLGDESYARTILGKADQLTEARYLQMVGEIYERLIAAGHLQPDEDAFENALR